MSHEKFVGHSANRPCEYPSCTVAIYGRRFIIYSDRTLPLTQGTRLEVCQSCYSKFFGVFE